LSKAATTRSWSPATLTPNRTNSARLSRSVRMVEPVWIVSFTDTWMIERGIARDLTDLP
jgi:hypothetical protein